MKRSTARQTGIASRFALMTLLGALAACNSQESTAPPPAAVAGPEAAEERVALAPPGQEDFASAYAEACPEAQPVGSAVCKVAGFGQPNFTCDFALGEDEYRRNTAELAPGEDSWQIAEPATACDVG